MGHEIVSNVDEVDWRRLIAEAPSSPFHTPEMCRAWARTACYDTTHHFLIENGRVTAMLQAHVIQEGQGIKGRMSCRAIVPGGFCHKSDSRGLANLLEHYERTIRKRAIYTQIRTLWSDPVQDALLKSSGWTLEEHITYQVDLTGTASDLLVAMKRDKRQAVNKAGHRGLRFVEATTREEVDEFFSMLEETYDEARVPLADRTLFDSVIDVLGPTGQARLFLAKCDDGIAGGRLVLLHKDTVIDFYAADRNAMRSRYPNEFLVYNIWLWGKEHGFTVFDFYGAGSPDEEYGVRNWKRRFGGVELRYPRYLRVHKPGTYRLAKAGYTALRRLKVGM